jgi:hypothetical protein
MPCLGQSGKLFTALTQTGSAFQALLHCLGAELWCGQPVVGSVFCDMLHCGPCSLYHAAQAVGFELTDIAWDCQYEVLSASLVVKAMLFNVSLFLLLWSAVWRFCLLQSLCGAALRTFQAFKHKLLSLSLFILLRQPVRGSVCCRLLH